MSARIGPALPGVTQVEFDDVISLFSPETCQVVVLNETASDVWRLVDGAHTLDEITMLLSRAYERRPDELSEHVRRAVSRFVDEGLIPAPVGVASPPSA